MTITQIYMKPSYNSIIVNSILQSQAHDLNPSQGEGLNLGWLNLGELKIIDIIPHVTMPNILWVGAQRVGGGGEDIRQLTSTWYCQVELNMVP
jgi:hypothetical protein